MKVITQCKAHYVLSAFVAKQTDVSKTVQAQDDCSIYGGKFCLGKGLPNEKV